MTSGHDDRVIDVEPKNVQEETFEHLYEDFTPGERPPLLRYKYSEPWMKPWAKRAIRVSPLLGITVNDGLYLRSSLGDGWLAFPLAGLVFSIFALITNHAAATPPAWPTIPTSKLRSVASWSSRVPDSAPGRSPAS